MALDINSVPTYLRSRQSKHKIGFAFENKRKCKIDDENMSKKVAVRVLAFWLVA